MRTLLMGVASIGISLFLESGMAVAAQPVGVKFADKIKSANLRAKELCRMGRKSVG